MKTFKLLITIGLVFITWSPIAQNLQDGFRLLETGKYAEAESFFSTILKSYPDNKTARLCYGRALGLNGKTQKANVLFTDLLKDYPEDFEVKLNYGESLLWNKNFEEAKNYYQGLVMENPKSFSALLGFANTLSNLKDYEAALTYVDKALVVSPENLNALTSKKYIYLGYAYQKQQAQGYAEAETLLTKNLELFNDDKDTLLNLANLYLIWDKPEDSEATYYRLMEQPEHKTQALIGLALVAHLKGKEKKALSISEEAYNRINNTTDSIVVNQTTERHVQALIWNRKFSRAQSLIENLSDSHPNANWVTALRATLNIYKSNFKESLEDYNKILKNDSTSFDGNLGKANVLKALGRYEEAYDWAENTLRYYTNQKDAVNFIQNLDRNFAPSIESRAGLTFDNGNNNAFSFANTVKFPLSTRLSLSGNYTYRSTNNTVTDNTANSNNLSMGISYQLIPNITINGSAGINSAKAISTEYTQLIADASLNIKSIKLQTIEIGFKRQIESFNADLLDQELVQNNYYLNYNLATNFKLGWYSQYIYTSQSDNNDRNLLFTSLYYNVLAKPALKLGLNYQHITFKDQVPNLYFSPDRFNALEVFLNIVKDENIAKSSQWFYNVTAAIGYQYIEDDAKQSTYRLQGAVGFKLSERSLLNAYGTHSNIASATAAGFTFTEIGLRFKWQLLNNALFR